MYIVMDGLDFSSDSKFTNLKFVHSKHYPSVFLQRRFSQSMEAMSPSTDLLRRVKTALNEQN